jgi:hypothetical protein
MALAVPDDKNEPILRSNFASCESRRAHDADMREV